MGRLRNSYCKSMEDCIVFQPSIVAATLSIIIVVAALTGCSRGVGTGSSFLPAADSYSEMISNGGAQLDARSSLRSALAHFACREDATLPCRPGMPLEQPNVHVGPARLPPTATKDAVQAPCAGQNLGAVCGYVKVPLDRAHPQSGSLEIRFELFTHTSYGPPESAIVFNAGGPGDSTTDPGATFGILNVLAQDLDRHDLLLLDDRGDGWSGTIECKPIQHGSDPWAEGLTDCASQLGSAASLYGTGDIAKDTEAVRAALGYDKVDYFVWSWGGLDATAYATRFPRHLRSLVLDAPVGEPNMKNYLRTVKFVTESDSRMVRLACTYSPTCRVDHPAPDTDLRRLIGSIRTRPLEGRAYDANGNLTHVRVDETNLASYIIHNPTGNFVSTGEIVAAARALSQKDDAPLLRLEAESYYPFPNGLNFGNPHIFSVGAEAATGCADPTYPWSWKASPSARVDQYADAVAALPANYYAPFSHVVALSYAYSNGRLCPWWELPMAPSPVVEPGAKFPDVPTLVLYGNMDDVSPSQSVPRAASQFPRSTLVEVAGSGHVVSGYSHCATVLESKFVETLQVGDTGCTQVPDTVFPAVGRFALVAADARPAAVDPNGRNKVGMAERRAVTVAVEATLDALKRSTIGSGTDACLRAGSFTTVYRPAEWVLTSKDCAFSTDVAVSGTIKWGAGRSLTADLSLSGSGTSGGTIHVRGKFEAPGSVKNFRISGALGGKEVALLVPEA